MLKLTDTSQVIEIPITKYNVMQIDYFKRTYPKDRNISKPVTFALQYFGSERTLVTNSGFSLEEATSIVQNYKKLYAESEVYKKIRQTQCCVDGFATVAFGLRIRTPVLAKSILGNSKTLREAEAEARSVGNAMFQSYGLLNNRASNAFMQRVWQSEYKHSIFMVAQIHDAAYVLMRDNINVVAFANYHLTREMSWQELPEIQHPDVKLGAELDLFYNGWHQPITLPNTDNKEELLNIIKDGVKKYS